MVMTTQPEPAPHNSDTSLPILILNVHSSCNCRCLMCDIWQSKTSTSLRPVDLERHRDSLRRLGVEHVVFTGGEPLLNADLPAVASFLRKLDIRITLLSTGLLLKKRAAEISSIADDIIVSLDGPQRIHDSIRRVPGAFALIAEGVAAVRFAAPQIPIAARCTVQKANHLHLSATVTAARKIGLDSLSFLAADVTSAAFNRDLLWPLPRQNEISLTAAEADELDTELDRLIATHAGAFASGFLAESPAKLRRIARSFRVHLGHLTAEAPRCNAPWVSAVVELDGNVRPCFSHPPYGSVRNMSLEAVVHSASARRFRESLNVATNSTCQRCVCSLNYPQKEKGPAHIVGEAISA